MLFKTAFFVFSTDESNFLIYKKIQPPLHSRRLAAPCGVADYVKGAVLFSDMEKADWIAPIGFICIYFCDLYADMNGECAVLGGSFKPYPKTPRISIVFTPNP